MSRKVNVVCIAATFLISLTLLRIAVAEPTAQELINEGLRFHERNNLAEAITRYENALKLESDNGMALMNLGNAHAQRAEFSKALEYFTRAAKQRPEDWEAQYRLGQVLKDLKRYPEAEKHFVRALELDPKNSDIHYDMGYLYLYYIKDLDKAIGHLKTYADQNPESVMGLYQLCKALGQFKGDYDKALPLCLKAVRLGPRDATAHHILGQLYAAMGSNDDAIEELKKTIELDPKHAEGRWKLGDLYLQSGNSAETRSQWTTAAADCTSGASGVFCSDELKSWAKCYQSCLASKGTSCPCTKNQSKN